MAALGSLVVQLGLNYAQFTGGLDKAEQAALAASKKVQDTFDNLKSKVAVTVGAIAGGIAAGFTVAAFKNIISGAIETGAQLDDLRMQTGASVEALTGLLAIGKFNNVGPEQLGAAMNKLSSNMAGATEESKGTGKALEALGIDFDKFKKLKPDEQMQTVAQAMGKFEDGTGKSAVAMALFGKQGAQMLPFLHDLAEVGELQAKMTTEQAAAAANFDDNLTRLTSSGDAWKKELANGMIPALDIGAQSLLDVMNGTGGLRAEVRRLSADGSIKEWTLSAIKGLTYVADAGQLAWRGIKFMAEGLGVYAAAAVSYFGGIGAAIAKALQGDFAGAFATVRQGYAEAGSMVSQFGQDWVQNFSEETLGSRIRARVEDLNSAGGAAKEAGKALDFTNVLDKDKKGADGAKDAMAALIAQIQGLDKLQQARAKSLTDDIAARLKTNAIDSVDALLLTSQAELASLNATKGYLADELAIYKTKKDGKKDVAATSAKIAEQDEKIASREKQLARDLIQTYYDKQKAQDAATVTQVNATVALADQLEQLQYEATTIGKTAAEVRVLEIARANEAAAQLEQEAAWKARVPGMEEEAYQLRLQAQLLREIAGQKGANAIAQEAATGWKEFTGSLYNGLTDSLYRSFEQGGKFFSTFWSGIRNTLKTSVLKVAIQGTLSVAGSAALAAAGVQTDGTSTGSALNAASTASSAYNLATGAGAYGAFGTGFSQGFAAAITNGGGTAFGVGVSNAASGAAAGSASTAASGVGQALGVAAPYVVAAALVLNALGVFRSTEQRGAGLVGTLGEGDIHDYALMRKGGTLFSGPKYYTTDGGVSDSSASLQQAYDAMRTATAGMAEQLGLGSDAIRTFTTRIGDDLVHPDTGGYGINLDGLTAEEATAKVQAALNSANDKLAALALGTTEYTRENESAAATLVRLSTSLTSVNKLLSATHLSMLDLSLASGDAASKLIDSAGGIEQFTSLSQSYYDALFSDTEKSLDRAHRVLDLIGAAGFDGNAAQTADALRAEYRRITEAQDITTESGRQMRLQLLAGAADFATYADELAAAAAESGTAAASAADVAQSLKDFASTATQLQIDLLTAKGRTAEAAAAQRALDTKGFTEAQLAAYDYNASLREQIAAAQAATAAEQKLAEARAAAVTRAADLVDSVSDSLAGVVKSLQTQAAKASGSAIAGLSVSAAEYTRYEGFANVADQAAAALAEIAGMGFPEELKGYTEQLGKLVDQTKAALVTALTPERLRAGDVAAAMAAGMSLARLTYADYTDKAGNFNAGAYNAALAKAQAALAVSLANQASAEALSVQNIGKVLGQLGSIAAGAREYVARDTVAGVAAQLGTEVSSSLMGALRDALGVITDQAMAQYTAAGPGLASVYAAQGAYAKASAVDYIDGKMVMGEQAIAYAKAMRELNRGLSYGSITADEFARAVDLLGNALGVVGGALPPLSAQMGAAGEAADRMAAAGLSSIAYYFDQIGATVSSLDAAAAQAASPVAIVTAGIGRMTSAATVFGDSAQAALAGARSAIAQYAAAAEQAIADSRDVAVGSAEWYGLYSDSGEYAKRSGLAASQLAAMQAEGSDVRKALLVSEAAKLAAQVMTTADAAAIAKQLAQTDAFAAADATGIKNAALLLDGLKANDATAFEASFARLANALDAGALTEQQYVELTNLALRTLSGEQAELDKQTLSLTSAFQRLRDVAKSTADALLTDESLSMLDGRQIAAETARQYADVLAKAQLGDTDAIGKLDSASKSMLAAAQNVGSAAEYSALFAETIRDLRLLEVAQAPASSGGSSTTTPTLTVPAFASGGYHTGGVRLVGENGPELEVTGPSRIFNAGDTSNLLGSLGNGEVVAQLREVVKRLESLERSNLNGQQAIQNAAAKGTEALEQIVNEGIRPYEETTT